MQVKWMVLVAGNVINVEVVGGNSLRGEEYHPFVQRKGSQFLVGFKKVSE